MKKKTANVNVPTCVMCRKELGRAEIEKIVAVCFNPACPNYSLLCIPEDTILRFEVEENNRLVDEAYKKANKFKKTAHQKKLEKILKK